MAKIVSEVIKIEWEFKGSFPKISITGSIFRNMKKKTRVKESMNRVKIGEMETKVKKLGSMRTYGYSLRVRPVREVRLKRTAR